MNRPLNRKDCEHEAIIPEAFSNENFEPSEEKILKSMEAFEKVQDVDFSEEN